MVKDFPWFIEQISAYLATKIIATVVVVLILVLFLWFIWHPRSSTQLVRSPGFHKEAGDYKRMIAAGKSTRVPIPMFHEVVSCQIPTEELKEIVGYVIPLLDSDNNDFWNGESGGDVSLTGGGKIFFSGLNSKDHLLHAQKSVSDALKCVQSSIDGVQDACSESAGVEVSILGKQSLYYIEGLGGLNEGARVGIDLRARAVVQEGPQQSTDRLSGTAQARS